MKTDEKNAMRWFQEYESPRLEDLFLGATVACGETKTGYGDEDDPTKKTKDEDDNVIE